MLSRLRNISEIVGKLRHIPELLPASGVSGCCRAAGASRCYTDGSRKYNAPVTPDQLPRPAGICSMFRLPIQQDTQGLDVCFVGVPIDAGTSNRPGTRFGPRQIRTESVLVRTYNKETGAEPYRSLQVADVGDIYVTMYDIQRAARDIRRSFSELINNGCKTLAMGGDHSITYPILQAYKEKYGSLGLIHIDAHLDVSEHQNGCDITHGTTFRRAYEEGILDPDKVIQIGMRGSGYAPDDYAWPLSKGFRVIPARHCYHKSLVDIMSEIRQQLGDSPVYVSFDIDALDPAFAPGTGTPEIGGLTSVQALEIIHGCRGLNIVGGDLVEVSPPYDHTGLTALTAANLLFELLCVLPGVKYHDVIV